MILAGTIRFPLKTPLNFAKAGYMVMARITPHNTGSKKGMIIPIHQASSMMIKASLINRSITFFSEKDCTGGVVFI